MKRILLYAALAAGLLTACSKDNPERLFEMVYPNILFTIPAGLPGGAFPQALVLNEQPSRYQTFLSQSGHSSEEVSAIRAGEARLTALDGSEFDYVDRISVRICPETSTFCTEVEEVFYLDYEDIWRQGSNLRLIPSLINAKRILSQERFKIEIWFTFPFTTPRSVDTRLTMSFDAVR